MTEFRRWFIAAVACSMSTGLAGAQPYLISTFAGGLPAPTAAPAKPYAFEYPGGVATDLFGNTYISTAYNCVFRLDSKGNLSRVAGICQQGFSGDGASALKAQLNNPQGLAVDVLGNLYIADQGNQRVRQVTPAGIISTVAGTGTGGFSGDNIPATGAELNGPQGLAVDAAGNLYVADSLNFRIRRVVLGGAITTVAGTGVAGNAGDGGAATAATLTSPGGLALDGNGNLYVSDSGVSVVRMINPAGKIFHIAGIGSGGYGGDSGPAIAATLNNPQGLATDAAGNLYVADRGNFRVRKISGGVISTYAGNGILGNSGDNNPATSAELLAPVGVALDSSGDLYIADLLGVVRKVDASGIITTVAGNGTAPLPLSGDGGPASLAQFATPWGIARDTFGNLFVADSKDNVVRKITQAGVISTFAGTGQGSDTGDGLQATAAGVTPHVVATDSLGNVYLADVARVRKVALNGTISTVAGNGTFGYSGDGQLATSASLQTYLPGLAVDSNQNIYIADWTNQRVRKVTFASGIISTVAGTGTAGYSGDGQAATAAQVNFPAGLALDAAGNLYIADNGNCVVRLLSATNGKISTVAGNGSCGSTGDGGQATSAKISNPWAVAVDTQGNLYIATQDNTIRMVTGGVSGGVISTIAGTGPAGYSGDGGPATSAALNEPLGLAVDSARNIYIADFANSAIRILQPQTEPLLTVSSNHSGVFALGQNGVFTVDVHNAAQAAATNGTTVTVTATPSSGATPVSMGGTGWSCSLSGATYSCQNAGSLAPGTGYGTLTETVSVAPNAPAQVTNQVTVSGGGSLGGADEDSVFIGAPAPTLEISASHAGNLIPGSQAALTINVANQIAAPPTSNTVTVNDTLPSGLSLVSMAGNGWNCNVPPTCTNPNILAGGAGYNPITVTVSVASNAASPEINTAIVSGGGSVQATATDTIVIQSGACFVTGHPTVGVADVQAVVNEALGTASRAHDLNQDGVVNVVDIQIVINAVLGFGCTI